MSRGKNAVVDTIGYMGNGQVHVEFLDDQDRPFGGLNALGNVSSASMSFTEETITMKDFMYGTLSTLQSKPKSLNGELTLTLMSLAPLNLRLGTFASLFKDAAVADHSFTTKAYKGKSIDVDGIIESVTSVTVAGALEPLVEGVDYISSDGTIYFYDNAGIEDGDSVTVVYDKAAVSRIEAFMNSGFNVKIVFDAMNIAYGNRPVKVTVHKFRVSPTQARQIFSEDYGSLELKGAMEVSKAVSGTGVSRMFKEEHVIAA